MTVACTRKTDIHYNSYLSLQDGSTLFFGSERLFEYIDVLFAVRKLIGEHLQFSLQTQELSVLPGEILLHLVNLCKTNTWSKYVENSNCLSNQTSKLWSNLKHNRPEKAFADCKCSNVSL